MNGTSVTMSHFNIRGAGSSPEPLSQPCGTVLSGNTSEGRRKKDVGGMAAGPGFDPPEQIHLGLNEALDLLAALEVPEMS